MTFSDAANTSMEARALASEGGPDATTGGAIDSPPAELCDRLRREWERNPLDRLAALEALACCARWLRDAGLPSEQVLIRIKRLLPVGTGSAGDQLATLANRNVLLSLTLAVYYRDADSAALERLWPAVERRSGRPHPAREQARIASDGEGEGWRVYERLDRRTPPGGSASLVFESASHIRRVTSYPADWRSLSDAELLRLIEPRAGE